MVTEQAILDESTGVRSYIWKGAQGTYLKLSPSAYHLAKSVEAGASFDEIAEAIGRRQGRIVPASEVEEAYRALADRIAVAEMRGARSPSGFLVRAPLLRAGLIGPVARALGPLFHPWAVISLLPFALIGIAQLVAARPTLRLSPGEYVLGYGLFVVSLLIHELGHVGACARFAARPGDVGIGVYWIFPVFYSDVTAAWQLRRWQRVVVDLGGSYVQVLIGGVFAVGYAASGWTPLLVATLMIVYSSVFILNPFLKFDGYWVVADALGVTNLAAQGPRLRRFIWARLRGEPGEPLPWPARVTVALTLYTVLAVGFWAYFSVSLVPLLWTHLVAYPSLVADLLGSLVALRAPTVGDLLRLLTSTYFVVVSVLLLLRLGQPAIGTARRIVGPRPAAPDRS